MSVAQDPTVDTGSPAVWAVLSADRGSESPHSARALSTVVPPSGPVTLASVLKGDRANTYSIRINDQGRICFRWTTAGPEDVEIVDDH